MKVAESVCCLCVGISFFWKNLLAKNKLAVRLLSCIVLHLLSIQKLSGAQECQYPRNNCIDVNCLYTLILRLYISEVFCNICSQKK